MRPCPHGVVVMPGLASCVECDHEEAWRVHERRQEATRGRGDRLDALDRRLARLERLVERVVGALRDDGR